MSLRLWEVVEICLKRAFVVNLFRWFWARSYVFFSHLHYFHVCIKASVVIRYTSNHSIFGLLTWNVVRWVFNALTPFGIFLLMGHYISLLKTLNVKKNNTCNKKKILYIKKLVLHICMFFWKIAYFSLYLVMLQYSSKYINILSIFVKI